MATDAFIGAALGVSASSGQLILARLAMQTTALAAGWIAGWPYVLSTSGEITTIPYFDVPTSFESTAWCVSSTFAVLTDTP